MCDFVALGLTVILSSQAGLVHQRGLAAAKAPDGGQQSAACKMSEIG